MAKVINNADIKDFCTYKLSGKIKKVVYPEDEQELWNIIKESEKYQVIGNGSNLIFTHDYDGVIIKLDKFDNLDIDGEFVMVAAGYSLPKLSLVLASKGLTGFEFASGIPGTIGGAMYMNAGAYGSAMSDVVVSAQVLDTETGKVKKLMVNELLFGYRKSIFSDRRFICLSATMKLCAGNKDEILSLIKSRRDKRMEMQPLEYPSAGSVFRNPDGDYAGRLIEEAGLKNKHVGDAYVSVKHANFIVNKGSASGEDVKRLAMMIQKEVKDKYDIDLIQEQEYVE